MAFVKADSKKADLFPDWEPILLTPFESMMVLDERPALSMTCAAEFYFDGVLDRTVFEQAYEQALSRHKLLWAVVEVVGQKQYWRPAAALPPLSWDDENAETEFASMQGFDLTREPGARTWMNTTDGKSVLRFDFHHACCDAVGGMSWVEDVFTIYDAMIRGVEPKLRSLCDARLKARDRVQIQWPFKARLHRTYVDLKKSFRLILTKPIPLPESDQCEPWNDRFVIRRMPESDLIRLRYAASDASSTLNDLLLVEFLCVLRDWVRTSTVSVSDRDHIRIITPMSLRDRADKELSAANKIGFSFLSRSLKSLADADTDGWSDAIASVNTEVDQARRLLLPAQFLKKLRIARRSQRWFQSLFADTRCWATAIMTQLGDPTRRFHHRFPRKDGRIVVGNLMLLDFVSCAPLRPLTRAILSTNAYGNELTLTMRCDPGCISRSDAESFMDDFVNRLLPRRATRK